MKVENWLYENRKKWARRLALPVMTVALALSVATHGWVRPTSAKAAATAPAAAPIDTESVSALIALDKAMETVAARVTPAVVNVTVTSRTKPESVGKEMPDDMQQFFGGPFGQFFGPHMRQRHPQIEHGMGSRAPLRGAPRQLLRRRRRHAPAPAKDIAAS